MYFEAVSFVSSVFVAETFVTFHFKFLG